MPPSEHPSPAATPPPASPPRDFHDAADAPRRELIVYGCAGIIDELGTAAYRNLVQLLSIGFGFSPLIASFFAAVKMLADGILDPVVAHLSDNTRSRWGRRRPYILAGGVLMAAFSLVLWLALPSTDRVKPNTRPAPVETVPATTRSSDGKSGIPAPAPAATASEVANPSPSPAAPSATPPPPTAPSPAKRGLWKNLSDGIDVILASSLADRRLLLFLLVMSLGISLASTLYSATYYALGVEIAPSYEGRTKAMAWRAFANNVGNLLAAGFLPFCLLPIFNDFREGNLVIAVLGAALGVPLALWCFFGTRERTVVVRPAGRQPSFWRSVREIGATLEFWRVSAMFFVLGKAIGLFQVFAPFLTIYYVCRGDLLLGASYSAAATLVGTFAGLASVPLVVALSRRFEKHHAFKFGLAVLLVGAALKYVCYDPERPWLILVVPLFYTLGNACVYNLLGAMMADVTDLDELRSGERREGMFGAVVSVLNKSTNSFATMASGALVVAVGFNIDLGAAQPPEVFDRMRIWFSFAPAVAGLLGFFLLWRYPLTRARVAEIKEQLAQRRAQAATAKQS